MERNIAKQIAWQNNALSNTNAKHSEMKAVCMLNNTFPKKFEHYWEGQECSKSWEIYVCGNKSSVCNTHWHFCAGAANSSARIKYMWEQHFPHEPYPSALQLAKRPGMPRKRRERYHMDSLHCETLNEVSI